MPGKAVAVHENDGHRAKAFLENLNEVCMRFFLVQRHYHFPPRADPLLDLDHPGIEHLGKHDVPVEDARAVLVRDAQRVAEAAGDEKRGALPFALEERVGRYRGAHLDRFDALYRYRLAVLQAENLAN